MEDEATHILRFLEKKYLAARGSVPLWWQCWCCLPAVSTRWRLYSPVTPSLFSVVPVNWFPSCCYCHADPVIFFTLVFQGRCMILSKLERDQRTCMFLRENILYVWACEAFLDCWLCTWTWPPRFPVDGECTAPGQTVLRVMCIF